MTLSLDQLRNGLALEYDLALPARPEDPEMRESTSTWLFDDSATYGFPRWGIELEASSWHNHRIQANIAFADGRVLNGAARADARSPLGPDSRPTDLGAGPLLYRCIEPFRRWTMSFDGPVIDTTLSHQIACTVDPARTTTVRLDLDLVMATPAWSQVTDAATASTDDALMGLGVRFEQLFRATGTFTVDGTTRPFSGTGLRIHRQSIRRMETFHGHCWQSALFPDGTAFGCISYPPGPTGTAFGIGYIWQDGRMHEARAANPPWLRRIGTTPDDVSFDLVSPTAGTWHITGHTCLSTFRIASADTMGLTLQQSGVQYQHATQQALGMIERSSPVDQTHVEVH